MADWTLITTTLGTAVVTGGFGYKAAKRAAATTIASIKAENGRVRAQIEAENERLRDQHREDHLRNGQGTYHRMLSADREFLTILEHGLGPEVETDAYGEDVLARFRDWHDLATGVVLFGTEEARKATLALSTNAN